MPRERAQFQALYQEFLFRLVDLEILSERADTTKLLGQFAAMLAAASLMLSGGAFRLTQLPLPAPEVLIGAWSEEHFLIATTMMVVGLFTVLCWDSTFPDRRDILILCPLPVRARTMFAAKVAALGTALSLTVSAVNVFTGISYPFALGWLSGGILGMVRSFAAYWATMLAAAAFLLCSVLALQGVAAQLLPRRYFLRLSGALQLAAFCLILTVYFLQPPLATPTALAALEDRHLLAWLPSYWFLALFQLLNGSMHPALDSLAVRALAAVVLALFGAASALLLSYFRTLRKTIEEPDIVPAARRRGWPPRFGGSLQTAISLFTARSLFRSRQHRLILAFYLGVGFAITLVYGRSLFHGLFGYQAQPWNQLNRPMLVASIVMMCFAVVGLRVVFALPYALRANWIFQVTMIRRPQQYLEAVRRSLLSLGVLPVWLASAVLFFSGWPPRHAAGHLVVLGLLGVILVDICLRRFPKIPFTCSYLPGKSDIHVTSGAYVLVLLAITDMGVRYELRALDNLTDYLKMLAVLGLIALWARRRTTGTAKSPDLALRFEEIPPTHILTLPLRRDGVVVTD